MTTFARKGSTSIASHGKGVLHKSVSSPAAAAALNDVHELVSRLDSRQPAAQPHAALPTSSSNGCHTLVPLQHSSSSSPRQYVVHEDLVVDIRAPASSASEASGTASGGSNSAHSQRTTPMSGAQISGASAPSVWGIKTPIPEGPVYSALRQERAKAKTEDAACGRRPSSPLSCSPLGACAVGAAAQDKKMQMIESSLEEAKTSNRLLSRALSAVQQRLKQTEAEREQLRRERDYFRNLALRFPFTLSAGSYDSHGATARRFQTFEN